MGGVDGLEASRAFGRQAREVAEGTGGTLELLLKLSPQLSVSMVTKNAMICELLQI